MVNITQWNIVTSKLYTYVINTNIDWKRYITLIAGESPLTSKICYFVKRKHDKPKAECCHTMSKSTITQQEY